MEIRKDFLESNQFYHIYNRGVNGEKVFLSDENYRFFLSKLFLYLVPVCNIYAYCLMPNHFHLVIKTRNEIEFPEEFRTKEFQEKGLHSYDSVVSKQLAKMISSYSQAFNKFNKKRTGNLFESPFKRIRIQDHEYLKNVIVYVHQNSLSITPELENYKFSSYGAFFHKGQDFLETQNVLAIFDGLENFRIAHLKN